MSQSNADTPFDPQSPDHPAPWGAQFKPNDVFLHPRKPNPRSTLFPTLITIHPELKDVDHVNLAIMVYFVIIQINPDFPAYHFYEPIKIPPIFQNDLKQRFVTLPELIQLLKWHFLPVGVPEHSLFHRIAYCKIPHASDPTKWTRKGVLAFPINEKVLEYRLFHTKGDVFLHAKFSFKEPLHTVIFNHFKNKDKNFSLSYTKSANLLELFLRYVRENPQSRDSLNPNFLICLPGSPLAGTFGGLELIHIGEILKFLWDQLDIHFPTPLSPTMEAVMIETKNRYLHIIDDIKKLEAQKPSKFFQ